MGAGRSFPICCCSVFFIFIVAFLQERGMQVTGQQGIPSTIGKLTALLTMMHDHAMGADIVRKLEADGYRHTVGKVGSMDSAKVIAAIETAAKNNRVIDEKRYRETHGLYHAILEALQGVSRGTPQIRDVLRTVGLTFAIVRGPMSTEQDQPDEGEWICVCMYGTIGAPKKGFEHEVLGFGINHI